MIVERMTWGEWLEFQEKSPALAARFAKLHPRQVPTPPAPPPPRYDRDRHTRAGRRWSDEDDAALRTHWGMVLPRLSKILGRSVKAIRTRAEELELGPPALALEAVTLRQLSEMSGFSTTKIRHAAAELGIELKRAPSTRIEQRGRARAKTFAVTPGQADRIVKRMLAGGFIGRSREWGKDGHPAACVTCARTDRPHKAKGRCSRCYSTSRTRAARSRLGDDAGVHAAQDPDLGSQVREEVARNVDGDPRLDPSL